MTAPPKLPTTSHAVLGLLSISAPMSGYDLAQAADRSIAMFWPISRSQVYGELARLESLGLIRGAEVAQERLPDKRVYELTPDGESALDAWAADPRFEPDRMRLGFCLKMFFGHRMPEDHLKTTLAEYRKAHAEHAEYLRKVVSMLGELPEAAYVRATAELGLRVAEAVVTWADEMLAKVPFFQHDHAEDVHNHEAIHAKARSLFGAAPVPRMKAGI